MWRALTLLEAAIIGNIFRAGLKRRTGRLINSIPASKTITERGRQIEGTVGPVGIKYAAIHEYGGWIYPKEAEALTIPIGDNQTKDGIPRISAREAFQTGRSFIYDGVIFLKEEGAQGKISPLFVLKKQVYIPPRSYLRPALRQNANKIAERFGVFLSANFGGEER
jgi:hypothetical protein